MKVNIDFKSILNLVMFLLLLFIGYKWYFSIGTTNDYKDDIKKLKKEYRIIESEREVIREELKKLKVEYDSITNYNNELNIIISELSDEIEKLRKSSIKNEFKLKELHERLREAKKTIEDIKNDIKIKNEGELLESLIKKII